MTIAFGRLAIHVAAAAGLCAATVALSSNAAALPLVTGGIHCYETSAGDAAAAGGAGVGGAGGGGAAAAGGGAVPCSAASVQSAGIVPAAAPVPVAAHSSRF